MEEPGWYTNWFDDSHWPYAQSLAHEFGMYTHELFIDNFHPNARNIWTHDWSGDEYAYCRGRMCYGIIICILVRVTVNSVRVVISNYSIICVCMYEYVTYWFLSDEPNVMALVGMAIQPAEGCFSTGDNLYTLSGSSVRLEDCMTACLV